MSDRLHSRLRCVRLISLLTLQGVFVAVPVSAACYNTPRAAVDALERNYPVSSTLEKSGYRVTKIQSDIVLGQKWAMIANCGHPEWSASALPVKGLGSLRETQRPETLLSDSVRTSALVHAGDIVQLWRQGSFTRIEVAGVSEERGGLGKVIRVRLLRSNTDDQSTSAQFSGIVRGSSSVEIQP